MVTGRGARGASAALVRFLDRSGALYLDTQESRGLVPADHPSVVGAVRAAVMRDADLVVVIGRKLDYQLGYGSPAEGPRLRSRLPGAHRLGRRRAQAPRPLAFA